MTLYRIKILITIAILINMGLFFLLQDVSAYQTNNDSFLSIPSHSGFNDAVYTMTIQNNRRILVGGEFTTYDGISSNRIIRLFSDGRKDDSFDIGSGFNDAVRSIIVQDDGKIVVGGHFTTYKGISANRIIRLNTDGSIDNSFVIGSGFNMQIRTIAIQSDGKFLVGGAITNYNGTNIYRIARLNTDGSIDNSFNVGLGFNNNIRSIAFQDDGKIILAGGFVVYNGTTTNRIIRVNPDGSRDNSFVIGSGFNEQINAVAIDKNGKILVGGFFTGYNGNSVNMIARLNIDGSLDTSFDIGNGFNSQVIGLIINNDKIMVGGTFTLYDSAPANGMIRLNDDGSIDTGFDLGVGFNNASRSFTLQSDGKILVGGDFTEYKGNPFGRLVRLHGDSHVSILDTDNKNSINSEFTSKGYMLSNSILSGSSPIVFIDTEGKVPVNLKLKNENILLTLPENLYIMNGSKNHGYTGLFNLPRFIINTKQDTIAAIQVGSNSTGLSLSGGVATISIPLEDTIPGALVEIFYSEDNGANRYPHNKTFVRNIDGKSYASFTTDHFTDFTISSPSTITGSFTINDDNPSTNYQFVDLNIYANSTINQMRFSNDGNFVGVNRIPYSNYYSRNLSNGTGIKTVYVQLDIDGDNESDIESLDTIDYIDQNNNPICSPGSQCGNLTFEIQSDGGYCEIGNSLDFGQTGFSYTSKDLIGDFLTLSGNDSRYCEDRAGLSYRNVTLQATNLINMTTNNPNHTIDASNIFLKNPSARKVSGLCSISSGSSLNDRVSIASVKTLFGKSGSYGEACKIQTDSVQLKVSLSGAQAVGVYSGIITIDIPNF